MIDNAIDRLCAVCIYNYNNYYNNIVLISAHFVTMTANHYFLAAAAAQFLSLYSNEMFFNFVQMPVYVCVSVICVIIYYYISYIIHERTMRYTPCT